MNSHQAFGEGRFLDVGAVVFQASVSPWEFPNFSVDRCQKALLQLQDQLERLGFTATGIAKAMQTDGTGTLLKVFEAINNLPGEETLSTLNALFGQWAIEGGAKITQNLGLLTQMLREVSDPSIWTGSMEKARARM